MKLTPRESEKLMLSYAGFLAHQRKDRGLKLNYVEAVAYITYELMEAARDGKTVTELMSLGGKFLTSDDVMDGVSGMVHEGDDNGQDVELRILKISNCPRYRTDQALEVLNELQMKYRYLRFTIDDDGYIAGEYDFPSTYENIGKGAVEMCLRLTMILDDCISRIKQFS